MKKVNLIYPIITVVFAMFLTTSCKKEEPATLPIVSTTPATNITVSSATSGGTLTSDGGATILANGVCWGTNPNPATTDSKTVDGITTGQFVSNITDLSGGTIYHIRAYATNSVGTAYGADLSFTTLGLAPTSLTQPATNISTTEATLNGTVNANYLSTTVTFEYGSSTSHGQTATASQSPVTGNSITNVSVNISGLTAGVTYHYRIKTVNSLGTTYGEDMTFSTSGQSPSVITQAACCLSSTGATLNGTVNPNFVSTTVTFEYGLTASYGNSIAANPGILTGNTSSNVSAVISGLTPGTTYHFRVKAVNSLGTIDGDDLTFTTASSIPILNTTSVSNVTSNSAISGGNITSDGGAVITARGVCWATSPNPINNDISINGIGTGSFVSNIKCLSGETIYYVRAYATNNVGTAYGDQQSFTTEISPIVFNSNLTYGSVLDIDENCYKTIQIGNQTWMAENLKTTKYNDGNPIPNVTGNIEWGGLSTPAYCWYFNIVDRSSDKGILYNWFVVNTGKLCPTGWHIPTYGELGILCPWPIDDDVIYGYELMETGTNHWNEGLGTNETGFTAVPGGMRFNNGTFEVLGGGSYYWSSSDGDPYPEEFTWYQSIPYSRPPSPMGMLRYKTEGLSVRCVKDN